MVINYCFFQTGNTWTAVLERGRVEKYGNETWIMWCSMFYRLGELHNQRGIVFPLASNAPAEIMLFMAISWNGGQETIMEEKKNIINILANNQTGWRRNYFLVKLKFCIWLNCKNTMTVIKHLSSLKLLLFVSKIEISRITIKLQRYNQSDQKPMKLSFEFNCGC